MAGRAKKRRKVAAAKADQPPDEDEDAEQGDERVEASVVPASGPQDKWKAVQMDMEVLQEFQSEGGLFIEEADADDFGIVYADAELANMLNEEPAPGKKRKRKHKNKGGKQAEDAPSAGGDEAVTLVSTAAEAVPAPKEQFTMDEPADLPAWKPFDLHPKLLAGLAKQGFTKPTDVQARCLVPAIRQRKDLVGAAETGSGKTLAFGLPILHHTLTAMDAGEGADEAQKQRGSPEPRALIILPTRELAVQVTTHLNNAAQLTSVRAECMVGGMSVQKQHRLLKRQPHVVVGTPGRLYALLGLSKEARTEKCDWLKEGCVGLRHLVLDEADRLTESGHFKELDRILGHVYEALRRPQQLQTFVFSATLGLDPRTNRHREREGGGKVAALMQRMKFREVRAVHVVDLTKANGTAGAEDDPKSGETSTLKKVAQLPEQLTFTNAVCTDDKDREAMLTMWLLRRYRWTEGGEGPSSSGPPTVGGRVVLFVNAISMVLRLRSVVALLLEAPSAENVLSRVLMTASKGKDPNAPKLKVEVLALQSQMRQKDRLKRMEKFRNSEHAVLICTDIAARGLDVKDVAAVLHYQAPRSADVFIHRSGRTARAGRTGESVAFMTPKDATQWQRLYRSVGVSKDQIGDVAPTGFEVTAAKEISRLALELESKVHKEGKKRTDRSWLRNAADEADLVLDDDADEDQEKGAAAAPRHALWGLYRQFLDRVRRPPMRLGAAPLPKHGLLGVRRRRGPNRRR